MPSWPPFLSISLIDVVGRSYAHTRNQTRLASLGMEYVEKNNRHNALQRTLERRRKTKERRSSVKCNLPSANKYAQIRFHPE